MKWPKNDTECRGPVRRVPGELREFTSFRRSPETYLKEGVVPEKSRVDARHIASATLARVDVLVSWNLKHIVNLQRIRGYNSANLKLGYPILETRSPNEVLNY